MKVKITNHASYRLHERSISMEKIKEALRNPDSSQDIFEGKKKVRKKFEKKTLEVIYAPEKFRDKKNEILVITAYFL